MKNEKEKEKEEEEEGGMKGRNCKRWKGDDIVGLVGGLKWEIKMMKKKKKSLFKMLQHIYSQDGHMSIFIICLCLISL